MKEKNLVPKSNASSPQEAKVKYMGKTANETENMPHLNRQLLIDALRRDMRDAAEICLSIRDRLGRLKFNDLSVGSARLILNSMDMLDDALAALDCSDHIVPSDDDNGQA